MQLERSRRAISRLIRDPAYAGVARLASVLTRADRSFERILVVGSEEYEPWHLVAHMRAPGALPRADLVRRHVAPGAPAHLSIGLDEIARVGRRDAVLLVQPGAADDRVLERVDDGSRSGAAILAIAGDGGTASSELEARAWDLAVVNPAGFDVAQHLMAALTHERR